MADFVTLLVEMGFSKDKAEKAVSATESRGIEPAIEWLSSRMDDESSSAPHKSPAADGLVENKEGSEDAAAAAAAEEAAETARSYKCEDCGKLFKNAAEMEFHAAKTKHTNFSESTEEKRPLTDEEKQEQLKRIEEKLKQKRREREEQEKKEALEREKLRMKAGKEVGEARRRFEEQEMKELVEARKKEKIDDKKARDRVMAQIEADKIARKAKYAAAQGGSGSSSETQLESAPPTPQLIPSATDSTADGAAGEKKEYTHTKLQLRLPSGKSIIQSFGVNEPLAAVRLYVELNRTDGLDGPFNLMTSFPRKVFTSEDYEVPLCSLGLVPTAVLMVTKSI